MEKFLDLLNSVKKTNNSTFYSCEPELIELMHQIDEMIEEKKKDWMEEMNAVNNNFQVFKDDNTFLRAQIRDLKHEISNVTKKLSEEKHNHTKTLAQYNKDVSMLKDDLTTVKKKYKSLQKKVELSKRVLDKQEVNKHNSICSSCQLRGENIIYEENNMTSPVNILKLQLEALQIENSNLRSLLHQSNQQILTVIDKNSSNISGCDNSSQSKVEIEKEIEQDVDGVDYDDDDNMLIHDRFNKIISEFETK